MSHPKVQEQDDLEEKRMKSIREMASNTKAYRSEIRRLVETDPKARQTHAEMRAELDAARQLHNLHKSDGPVETADAKHTHKTR